MPSNTRVQNHRKRAFASQGGRCYYCCVRMWLLSPDELPAGRRNGAALAKLRCTAEHLVAQCGGGTDAASNTVAACARCNHTRHRLPNPPEPAAYRRLVASQVEHLGWHQRWVFEAGLSEHVVHRGRANKHDQDCGSRQVRPEGCRGCSGAIATKAQQGRRQGREDCHDQNGTD